MQRLAKRVAIVVGALLGALLLVLLLVFFGANTGPGRALVTELVPRLTGGTVKIAGLAGDLPGKIRLRHLILSDASGPWLTARDVTLDWRPLRLLAGTIVVDRLTAPEVHLIRLPVEEPAPGGAESRANHEKPTPLIVRHLAVERLDVGAALAPGVPALAFTASGERTKTGREALKIAAHPLSGGGFYRLDARLTPDRVALTAHVEEPAGGLLAGLAGLTLPGPLHLEANLSGPRSAIAIELRATAGPLQAHAAGHIDLAARSAQLVLSASAPAMQPRPGISWHSVALNARFDGPFATPSLAGKFTVDGLSVNGGKVAQITAHLTGGGGLARLEAKFSGITLPGPAHDLFAEAPLLVDASAALDMPDRPVSFTLHHPLITVAGTAETRGQRSLEATIELPDLRPLAAAGGMQISGKSSIKLSARQTHSGFSLSATSALALESAPAPLLQLLGAAPRIALTAELRGDTATVSDFSLIGSALSFSAHGNLSAAKTALAWQGKITDLEQLDQTMRGSATAHGTLTGPTNKMTLVAKLDGALGTVARAPQPFRATLAMSDLPAAPKANLTAKADFDGAPFDLALALAQKPDRTFAVTIERAEWKTVRAHGALTFGPAALASGRIVFAAGNLGDFSAIAGAPLGGSLAGTLIAEATRDGPELKLALSATSLAGRGITVGKARLNATLLHPLADRRLDATLRLEGISAGGATASAELAATGPIDHLALRLDARSATLGNAMLDARALVDPASRSLSLSALSASFRGQELRLLAPARIVFAPDVAIAGLRLGIAGAEFDASGRLSPDLALNLTLRNATQTLFASFLPGLAVKGRLDAQANLTGSLDAPRGTLRLDAAGLGLSSGLAAGLPAANLDLTASLAGRTAQVNGTLGAGNAIHLALAGSVPLSGQGPLGLSINGDANLAAFEPALAAAGRRIAGRLALAATVGGSFAAPTLAGTARLSEGAISDYESGLRLTAIGGDFALDGTSLGIRNFVAHAGPGTISLSGSVGVLAPGIPISLALSADNAELLQSDLATVRLDSALRLSGLAMQQLALSGRIHIRRAEIRIPSSLPPDIAVLDVVRPGQKPRQQEAALPAVALDVTLDAPREIFVRGRGVDAEFGGRIHVSGTIAAPIPEGSFHLIRGQVSLAGQTLTFTSGTIGFNGGEPTNPALNLVATTRSGTTTATLTLGGTVQKPTVTLSSVPELPQDQVLAALLFGTGTTSLSPLQLAQMAGALASLTGAGPGIGNPLGAVRKGLGLDQLTIGADANGKTAVQAGRYIAPGVYVGASQSTAGTGTEAQVKIDLTKHLQLNATVGNGGGNATAIGGVTQPSTRNGSSVGLTYQFEY